MQMEKVVECRRNTLFADTRPGDRDFRNGGRFIVVRLWNDKTENFFRELFRRIEGVAEAVKIDGLILVLNGNDQFGRACETLDRVRLSDAFPTKVLEVRGNPWVREWTVAANGAITWLRRVAGVSRGQVWYASGDAEFTVSPLLTMDAIGPIPFASVRQGPEDMVPSGGHADWLQQCDSALQGITEVIRRKDPSDLLGFWATHLQWVCRNTCQSWRLDDLIERRGFDPRCNVLGGQEDTAHLIWLAMHRNCTVKNLSKLAYIDPNLLVRDSLVQADQRKKLERERVAIRKIIEMYAAEGGMEFAPDFDW